MRPLLRATMPGRAAFRVYSTPRKLTCITFSQWPTSASRNIPAEQAWFFKAGGPVPCHNCSCASTLTARPDASMSNDNVQRPIRLLAILDCAGYLQKHRL